MWLSRIYGTNQQDAFFKRDGIEKRDKLLGTVEIDEPFCSVLHKIQERIHQKDLYASKLLSVFSIYYSVLRNFSNSEQECISFCTILETLLLGKDEDKQRKKVSVRAACLKKRGFLQHKFTCSIRIETALFTMERAYWTLTGEAIRFCIRQSSMLFIIA